MVVVALEIICPDCGQTLETPSEGESLTCTCGAVLAEQVAPQHDTCPCCDRKDEQEINHVWKDTYGDVWQICHKCGFVGLDDIDWE